MSRLLEPRRTLLMQSLANALFKPNARPSRMLGLDVGVSYVGVALTDQGNTRAIPINVIPRRKQEWQAAQYYPQFQKAPDPRFEGVKDHLFPSSLMPDGMKYDFSKFRKDSQNPLSDPTLNRKSKAVLKTVPLPTSAVIEPLRNLVLQNNVIGVVVGLPLEVDGTKGWMCEEVEHFVYALRMEDETGVLTNLKYYLWDERHSTQIAKDQIYHDNQAKAQATGGQKRAKQVGNEKSVKYRKRVDKVAAQVILQDFVDRLKLRSEYDDRRLQA